MLSADTSLSSKLSIDMSTEESVRLSADTSLTSRLSLEESVRSSADSSLASLLGNDVSVEASARFSADTSLESKLSIDMSTEISVRSSADTSLEVRLSTEEVLRNDETNAIDTRLNITPVVKAFTIGDGATSSFTVSHNLNTKDVIVQVFEIETGETVEAGSVRKTGNNEVQIDFNVIPDSNAFRVVIMGIQLFQYNYSI